MDRTVHGNLIILITILLLLAKEFAKCQDRVYVCNYIAAGVIYVNCSVDNLIHDITLFSPSGSDDDKKYFASCLKSRQKKGQRKCNESEHIQDLETNTTIFRIGEIGNAVEYGKWKCTHGNLPGFTEVKDPKCIPETRIQKDKNPWFAVAITFIALTVLSLGFIVYLTDWRSLFKKMNEKTIEEIPLLENQDQPVSTKIDENNCHTCKGYVTCAICANCNFEYCEICCNVHTMYYPDHAICQIQHYFTSAIEVFCKLCRTEKATVLCNSCRTALCKNCYNTYHDDHPKKLLNPELTRQRIKDHKPFPKETKLLYSIPIEKEKNKCTVRICGLAFLEDCRLVVADSNNQKFSVYKKDSLQFEHDLEDEPRGMSESSGNNIAITLSYEKQIKIYELTEKTAKVSKTIKLGNLGLNIGNIKPFSISYNRDHFAVEVGEGDDGMILILDKEGSLKFTVPNTKNYAFFTGNTIRLALNMNNERIYISNPGKKVVTCVDFIGNVIWNAQLPGSRSIILIPEEEKTKSGKNIICASRNCSVIFRLNEEDGSFEPLLVKERIRSPRYLAYHSGKEMLCIQVAKDSTSNDSTGKDSTKNDSTKDPEGEELLIYNYF